jgi:hypothetical protein
LNLYRVLPLEPGADDHEAGGALFVPGSTNGRIDNVGVYKVQYLAREPEGAVAETYGRIPLWKPAMLKSASGVPHSLVTYSLPDTHAIFSLDDAVALASLGVANPSQIVARNRPFTQALALRIYERHRYTGVSWWNYYEPAWTSFGLWDISSLEVLHAEQLANPLPLVQRTAEHIVRQFIP